VRSLDDRISRRRTRQAADLPRNLHFTGQGSTELLLNHITHGTTRDISPLLLVKTFALHVTAQELASIGHDWRKVVVTHDQYPI